MTRPLAQVIQAPMWCRGDERVRDVAARMGEADRSCVLVRSERGLGIVTDHDFRHRVATGSVSVDAPVTDLATVPALTIADDSSAAAALLRMVEHGIHHLAVTDRSGAAVGIVRAVDLAQFEVREPLLIRSAIDTASTVGALAEACRSIPTAIAELRDNGVPALHAGAVHAALVDAVVRRALDIRAHPVLAGVRHSWILLGSLARREPLPSSDLDTALMWADPPTTSPELADAIRAAAAEVLDDLRHCGLKPCPDGARADNPMFSRSQSAWAAAATAWLHDPTADGALLWSAMVTDSRPVTEFALGQHLTDTLMSRTRTSYFLRALLDEAVSWRTSTGRFRDFVVRHAGEHRGQVDLKRGGLVPVVALGRWIAIVTGDARGTTTERLNRGADAALITKDERHTLVGGFESVYTVLYDFEILSLRSGSAPTTYLNPNDLDSLTRRHLRETLRAIGVVQNRVDQSWVRRLER